MSYSDELNDNDKIAIIGMAGRFPGARDIEQFWQNIRSGVESISSLTDQELLANGVDAALLHDPNYVKAAAMLEQIEWFDASFFGYSPREAEIIDPQQRLFLECAWQALEAAGYCSAMYRKPIGVYAGISANSYLLNNLYPSRFRTNINDLQVITGNDKDYLATRVSYKLELEGPSVVVQTACSTSLVAVHLGCDALLSGQCDMVLAGGSTVIVPQKEGYIYREGGIASPDGHCRAFAFDGRGTVFGSGVGIVVLKRLEDALADGDEISAVIRGSAINNDGASKIGYTAPSIEGQAKVIAEALEIAKVAPESISYVETHGTGTPLGDPIEIAALTQAFGASTRKKGFCAIGSVKTNIGHLNTAAGVASLIKTALALKYQMIPPSLHFSKPNANIDFNSSPFYVNTTLHDWDSQGFPRRAGVSSFGVGGTNAHVVLEESPPMKASGPSRSTQLLLLSAKTTTALDAATNNLAGYLKQHPDLNFADVAYTLKVGRKAMNCRRVAICRDQNDAVNVLQTLAFNRVSTSINESDVRSVVFMFTGQGAQYVNMAFELYTSESVFRDQVNHCSDLLKPFLGLDLRDVLYPSDDKVDEATRHLTETAITQPALFTIEYALARLLMEWGIQPKAMIGHSIGEYVAACLAGVFSLEDGLMLVANRGRMMNQLPAGSMLAIPLPEDEVLPSLGEGLSLAVINAPSTCVVSGPSSAIEQLEGKLVEQDIVGRRLQTSHAFHSQMMEPILDPFREQVGKLRLNAPKIPYLSNVTGNWITNEQATDPNYWAAHLRQTVRFSEGIGEILKGQNRILLEVGPGETLTALSRRHPNKTAGQIILPSIRHPRERQSDVTFLLGTLGKLWQAGVEVKWAKFYEGERRRRVALPTYPFERQRFWIEPAKEPSDGAGMNRAVGSSTKSLNVNEWFYIPSWKQTMPPRPFKENGKDTQGSRWLVFADKIGVSRQLGKQLELQDHDVIMVIAGNEFAEHDEHSFTIRPGNAADYKTLVETLGTNGRIPEGIIHMWSVSQSKNAESRLTDLENSQQLGFYSLLYLAQALGSQQIEKPLRLLVISNNLFDVAGDEQLEPEKATILGPCKTIPQEYEKIICRCLDIDIRETAADQIVGLADRILVEISSTALDPVVAFRGRHRWVQTYESVELEQVPEKNLKLRNGGVYLITGGLGRIGIVLADYLARTVKAKLVLVGRTIIPDRDQWEQWMTTHRDDDDLSRRILKVQDLEKQGAEVLLISADVASLEQMKEAISQMKKRFGSIHGIIHAAGIAGGGVIQLKRPEVAARVLAPKVKGTLVLDEVVKDMPLDWFVLCSCTLAITSRFGQADYCGANAFLDAFAHYKAYVKQGVTISINWDVWREVGMADNANAPAGLTFFSGPGSSECRQVQTGLSGLPEEKDLYYENSVSTKKQPEDMHEGILPAQGVEALSRILAWGKIPQMVVSTVDLQQAVARLGVFGCSPPVEQAEPVSFVRLVYTRPGMVTEYVAPSNEAERVLARIWQEELGIDRVGINDNFFELGGNSLIAVQIISKTNKAGFRIAGNHIIEFPTIAEIALLAGQPDLSEANAAGRGSRTEMELQLVEIWERLLNVHPIDIQDSFLKLQGQTNLLDQMLAEIRCVFGVFAEGFPVDAFLEKPTIETAARIISGNIEQKTSSLVVCLQPEGSKRPLFLIHAGGGYVFFYRALALRLGTDRPVYGIRAETISDGLGCPFTLSKSFEEIATRYIAEIKKVQPVGPYTLGGACVGAIIAYEMAQQLRSQGEKLAGPILVFDGVMYNNPNLPKDEEKMIFQELGVMPQGTRLEVLRRRFTQHFHTALQMGSWKTVWYIVSLIMRNAPSEISSAVKAVWCRLIELSSRLSAFRKPKMTPLIQETTDTSLEKQKNFMQESISVSMKLMFRYVPSPYAGRIVVFKCKNGSVDLGRTWTGLALGGLVEHEMPGAHLDMMEEPEVRETAGLVRECLQPDDGEPEAVQIPVVLHQHIASMSEGSSPQSIVASRQHDN